MVIYNPGSVVRFSQSMYRVFEDDELVQPALVLNNPSSSEITVQVNDNSITATGELINIMSHTITLIILATEGDDYNSGPYFVNFPARTTIVSFNVSIVKDNITEGNENFQLVIDSSTLPDGVTVDATSNRDTEIIIVSVSNDEGEYVCVCVCEGRRKLITDQAKLNLSTIRLNAWTADILFPSVVV